MNGVICDHISICIHIYTQVPFDFGSEIEVKKKVEDLTAAAFLTRSLSLPES